MWNRIIWACDEWGGAESRGNGARPVEWMIMNDTCATHRSRVPRRSFGRDKWGVTTLEDERGPGLDFSLCFVCGSRPWGAAAFHLCLFIWLNVFKCSPVPASFFPYISTSLQSPLTADLHVHSSLVVNGHMTPPTPATWLLACLYHHKIIILIC